MSQFPFYRYFVTCPVLYDVSYHDSYLYWIWSFGSVYAVTRQRAWSTDITATKYCVRFSVRKICLLTSWRLRYRSWLLIYALFIAFSLTPCRSGNIQNAQSTIYTHKMSSCVSHVKLGCVIPRERSSALSHFPVLIASGSFCCNFVVQCLLELTDLLLFLVVAAAPPHPPV